MWFHRRMLHISWKDHVTNYAVLRRGRTERKLMNRIRAGQMSFLGHIMRKHGLENIVVTGKIEGERSRGRPRLNFMKSLSQLLKISEVEIIERKKPGRVEHHDRQRPNWIRHLEREITSKCQNQEVDVWVVGHLVTQFPPFPYMTVVQIHSNYIAYKSKTTV